MKFQGGKDSNWTKFKKINKDIKKSSNSTSSLKNTKKDISLIRVENSSIEIQKISSKPKPKKVVDPEIKMKYVGLDCEMVGVGLSGNKSVLARACLVNWDGNVIYDKFVRPSEYVTDFRTKYSGIRKEDFRKDSNAITLEECQKDIAKILKNKIVVGHSLKNDFNVLLLRHSRNMIRDTATYRPYMRNSFGNKFKPRALRDLAKQYLQITIQEGEHDPGIDARTAMELYKLEYDNWEKGLVDKNVRRGDHLKASFLK